MRLPDGVVLKYYLYNVTLSHGLVTPITVEYLLTDGGLTFSQLGTIGIVSGVTWTLVEVPSGYLGDRIGRRNSLVVASLLSAIALAVLGVGQSFPAFLLGYFLLGVGTTFRSGSGSAWLYDLLAGSHDESEFTRIKSRGWSVRLTVTEVGAIAGAALASVAWIVPFAINAVLVASGSVVLLTLPKSGRFAADADTDDDLPGFRDCLSVIRDRFTAPPLRAFILYLTLFFGLVEVALTYVQPISTDLGLAVAHLGPLYAGFSLVSAGASYVADDVRARVGIDGWMRVAPLVVGLLFVAMAVVPVLAFFAFFVTRGVRSITMAFRSQYLNDHLGSARRATVLSAVSMLFGLTAGISRQVGGFLADATSSITMLAVFGGLFVLAGTAIHAWETPVGDASKSRAREPAG